MFTVKLMTGQPGQTVKFIEAREVEVRSLNTMRAPCPSGDFAVIVRPGPDGLEDFWHYIGNDTPDAWQMAVIENAAGKTTEVVRPTTKIDPAVRVV